MAKSLVLVKSVQSHHQQFVLNVYLSHCCLSFSVLLVFILGGIFEALHTADLGRVLLFCRLGNIVVASSKTGEPITADDMVCKQLENTLLRWRLQSNLFLPGFCVFAYSFTGTTM